MAIGRFSCKNWVEPHFIVKFPYTYHSSPTCLNMNSSLMDIIIEVQDTVKVTNEYDTIDICFFFKNA